MRAKRTDRFFVVSKRLFDILFSAAVLIVLSPVFAIIALAIRITSPGPILFRQQRVGLNGALFTIYKFRTMEVSADPYALTPQSDDADRRVIRIGRLLRKSGLDELPQFFNVLKGDMSIVGPRPEMQFLVNTYDQRQRRRLSILPGITGLWQISEARREPIHHNMQYDLFYIQHRSFWLDLKVIARTAWIVVRRRQPETVRPVRRPQAVPAPHINTSPARIPEHQHAEVPG